jgi:putative oxidoreductase
MSIFETSRSPWTGRMLSIFRIIAGFNFPPAPMPGFPVRLLSEMGAAGVIETIGGLAIVLGLFTRPVAFILAGEMAVAYFQVQFPKSFFPTVNGGVPAVLYCFLFLYLIFAGAGPWSLDARIARRRYGDRAAIAGIRPRYSEQRPGQAA